MDSKSFKRLILALFFITLLFKIFYLDKVPFHYDDTLYAEMIAQEAESLTFLPKYLDMWTPWKPGLYYIFYSLFLPITSAIFASLEWTYRFPNLIFGLMNAFLFYKLAQRFATNDISLMASLLFYSSFSAFRVEGRLLMEPMMLTLILVSLLFYTSKKLLPSKRFGGAALFSFLASITKSVVSFTIVPLSLAALYQKDRKFLKNPLFLISLLAPFLGLLVFYLSLQSLNLAEGVLLKDTGKFVMFDYAELFPETVPTGLIYFFFATGIYLVISLKMIADNWKKEIFFTVWTLISLVIIFSGEPHEWYFYYVIPAFSFFVASALPNKGKADNFSALILLILVVFNISLSMLSIESANLAYFWDSKEIGTMLAGKENVLVAGSFSKNTIIVAYKILLERQMYGEPLDFGYLIFQDRNGQIYEGKWEEIVNDIVVDYGTDKYYFEEENFAALVWQSHGFKKKTSITEFDYVVVTPPEYKLNNPDFYLCHNASKTVVYCRSGKPELN